MSYTSFSCSHVLCNCCPKRPVRANSADSPDLQAFVTADSERGLATPEAPLIRALAEALGRHGVRYCQWKGHRKRARWGRGLGDIDLLVDRTSAPRFAQAAAELGFKRVLAAPSWHLPGVESHYGYDPTLGRLVHVHVHYRLVVGSPWRTTYALPLEDPCLACSGGERAATWRSTSCGPPLRGSASTTS
jgi:hypothetical protein